MSLNRLIDLSDRRLPPVPPPCALVLFGATGDLSRRKILPAIYDLANRGWLPGGFSLTGVGRSPWSREDFIRQTHTAVAAGARTPFRQRVWEQMAAALNYVTGDVADPSVYVSLHQALTRPASERGTAQRRIFYLALPPGVFATVCAQLVASGLAGPASLDDAVGPVTPNGRLRPSGFPKPAQNGAGVGNGAGTAASGDSKLVDEAEAIYGTETAASGDSKLVAEKPFGRDLTSAQGLDQALGEVFRPGDVFRIDHYLGRETVHGMLALRFANQIFEPLWCSQFIDHVQITMSEDIGVGSRANYYDTIGATRDVLQNHLLQLLAFTALEGPGQFRPAFLRAAKEAVLAAARLGGSPAKSCARGQYGAGWQGNLAVRGYREEPGVATGSVTDTYAATKLEVAVDRWRGTPFYLRTGKRLGRRVTEVALVFKQVASGLRSALEAGFEAGAEAGAGAGLTEPADLVGLGAADLGAGLDMSAAGPNALVIRLQPDQGVTLRIGLQVPQTTNQVRPVTVDLTYGHALSEALPDAYEQLLLDVMLGADPLFASAFEAEQSWRLIDQIETYWAGLKTPPEVYPAGTWGPSGADQLLRRDGREWRRP
ncbi:MAG: glucose-6-phosphate dehydrogenase (NADP(+)) [Bifidobacteriaceae bacterium]|jgi:glucose-6-phosphate 1-dehydrogenase|nr:glucose-6-phosphate dehydrogenase (NADP(+)) [Bifidobacteriaceae bacterium]